MDNFAKGRLLVTIQFMLLGGLVLISSADVFGGNKATDIFGVVLELSGLAIVIMGFRGLGKSLTANPVPIKNGQLVTTGIYARVRHPIYLGLIIATLGMVLTNGSQIKFYFWIPLVALFIFKIRFEEALLQMTYPGYKKYMEQVPALLPKIKL